MQESTSSIVEISQHSSEILKELQKKALDYAEDLHIYSLQTPSDLAFSFKDVITGFDSLFMSILTATIKSYRFYLLTLIQPQITKQKMEEIGNELIQNHLISRFIVKPNIIPSLTDTDWVPLSEYIFSSPTFQSVFRRVKLHLIRYYDAKIEAELSQVPMVIDSKVKEAYKRAYYQNPISFSNYLALNQTTEKGTSKSSTSVSNELRSQFERALERKKIDVAKQEQLQSFDNYEAYLKMDERELDRAKRASVSKRKFSKQTRREKYQ